MTSYVLWQEPLIELVGPGWRIRIKEEERTISPLTWQVLQKIAVVTQGNSNIRCCKERLLPFFKDEDYLISSPDERLFQYISLSRRLFREYVGNQLIQGNASHGYYIGFENSFNSLAEPYNPIKLDESELKYCFEIAFYRITKILIAKIDAKKRDKIGRPQKRYLSNLLRLCKLKYTSQNLYKILNRLKTRRIDIAPQRSR